MKKVSGVIAVAFFLIIFFGFYFVGVRIHPNTEPEIKLVPATSEVESVQPLGDKTIALRKEIVRGYLDDFQYVVEKTGDQQAKDGLLFLLNNMQMAIPNNGGVLIDPELEKTRPLKVIALIASDKKWNPWKSLLEDKAGGAMYIDELKSIILKELLISPVYKGLIIAHETDHARRGFADPGRKMDLRSLIQEEVEVYTFQNRLLARAGGKAYEEVLLANTEKLRKEIISGMQANGSIVIPDPVYDERLDAIFGPPLSETEREARATLLRVDTVFHLFDIANPGEAPRMKWDFVKSWYGNLHALPQK